VKWLFIAPVLLASCGFELPRAQNGGGSDATNPDQPGEGNGPEGGGNVTVPCATPDATGLVACFEMEDGFDDGELSDSAPAHRNAKSTGLATAERPLPPTMSTAAKVTPTAVTRIAQDAALDRAAGYTLAMWVQPDSLPAQGSAYGLLDHELQYAMVIGLKGSAEESRCVHTGVPDYEWTENLPTGTWSFLACTWDGAQLCAYRWTATGSHEHFCHQPTLPPAAVGAQGLAIGHLSNIGAAHSRFDGALDSVQIYDHSLGEDQLCALIGEPAGCLPCNTCQ